MMVSVGARRDAPAGRPYSRSEVDQDQRRTREGKSVLTGTMFHCRGAPFERPRAAASRLYEPCSDSIHQAGSLLTFTITLPLLLPNSKCAWAARV
jgi:hypothetical protein